MQKHFACQDGKSNKFWNISTDGNSFTVRYGKTGTDWQEKTKTFGSAELCEKEAEKLVLEKLKKGYIAVNREEPGLKTGNPTAEPDGEPDEFFEKYGKRPPAALKKLLGFKSEFGNHFSDEFELELMDKVEFGYTGEGFSDSFIGLGKANGSGSLYAIWIAGKDLEKCPIVVFGDEGGIPVVAENMRQFIRLLTYDTEVRIDRPFNNKPDKAEFYKSEDDDFESPNRPEFLKWAKENFGVDPIETNDEARKIVSGASEKLSKKYNAFLKKYKLGFEVDKNLELLDSIYYHEDDVDTVKMLLKNWADANTRDREWVTALMKAKNTEIAKLLLEHWADVNAKDKDWVTALMKAKNTEIAKLLLESWADASARSNDGKTALMECRSPEIAKLLIEIWVDVNATTNYWRTALMNTWNIKIAQLLIENGADADIRDNDWETALMKAKKWGYADVVKLLEEMTR